MAKPNQPTCETETDAQYEGGAGSTLVLLHGIGNTWRAWKPVLPLLREHHRVVAITLPGHHGGPATPDPATLSIATMSDAVLGQLNALGIESAHIAGNSLGGWLALELHRRGFAESVTALSPAGAWTDPADTLRVARQALTGYALSRSPALRFIAKRLSGLLYFSVVRRTLLALAMTRGDQMTAEELKAVMGALSNADVLPGLIAAVQRDGAIVAIPNTTIPIRIAWGQYDRIVPFERFGRPMLAQIPSAEHVTLPGVGHVPMHDDPHAVAKTILEVTQRARKPAPRSRSDAKT